MYSLKEKETQYQQLALSVFPVHQTIHFTEHPQYPSLINLLNICNEVESLIVTIHPGHNRYQQELHYIGEPLAIAKERALSTGTGIISHIIKVHTHDGWTLKQYEMLDEAKTFDDAFEIALQVINNQCTNIACMTQVCGPISTGGYGTVDRNLLAFHYTIQKLKKDQLVFDQMPFEPLFHRIHAEWIVNNPGKYMHDILDKFYLPLFERGHIKKFAFMHNYESSQGALWEHEQAIRLNMEKQYLPEGFIVLPL